MAILGLIGLLTLVGAAPLSADCPTLDGTTRVRAPQVAALGKKAKAVLGKKTIHVNDLGDAPRAARERLSEKLTSQNICDVWGGAQLLLNEAKSLVVNGAFVKQKAAKLQALVANLPPPNRKKAEVTIKKVSRKKPPLASRELNKVWAMVTGAKSPWDFGQAVEPPPPSLPKDEMMAVSTESVADTQSSGPDVRDREVKAACPDMGFPSAETFAAQQQRLKALFDKQSVRTLDLQDGVELMVKAVNLAAKHDYAGATRILCGLVTRTEKVQIDLAFVSRRLQEVRSRRPDGIDGSPVGIKFAELTRSATGALSESDFVSAHKALEELLVVLGEPSSPGDTAVVAVPELPGW